MRIWKAEDSVSNDASTAPLLGSYDLRRRRAHVAGIPAKIGKSGRRFPDDSCVVRPLIGDSCGRHLAISVIKKAPAAMASRAPSPDEKLEAYRCILRIRWTKKLMRAVATRNLCGLMRRWRGNPATSQLAMELRAGLRKVRNAVGGGVDIDPSIWRAYIELKGLTKEATKHG